MGKRNRRSCRGHLHGECHADISAFTRCTVPVPTPTMAAILCIPIVPSATPTLIPKRSGDRVKTNRRDSVTLVKLSRAGELRAIWVPDSMHEAVRDLTRVCGADVRLNGGIDPRPTEHLAVPCSGQSGMDTLADHGAFELCKRTGDLED
jgi:hypothetical protein